MIATIREQLIHYSDYTLVTTGHSLGGALASLAAVTLRANFPESYASIAFIHHLVEIFIRSQACEDVHVRTTAHWQPYLRIICKQAPCQELFQRYAAGSFICFGMLTVWQVVHSYDGFALYSNYSIWRYLTLLAF
jgi:hypothetical protein